MKITVSIPDELWLEVHGASSEGPSATVQRGLRLLADQLRAARRPLAHAPVQNDLDRYRAAFEEAVHTVVDGVTSVLDRGYRFGLLLAPGLTDTDFETLDRRGARREIQELIKEWGAHSGEGFSTRFASRVEEVLGWFDPAAPSELRELIHELLGDEGDEEGVRWVSVGERTVPEVSDTFTDGILAALIDVRDEARRRADHVFGGTGRKE